MTALHEDYSLRRNTEPRLTQQWKMDIQCVFERDPAARSYREVITTYPGVHAILLHRLTHRLWQRGMRFSARWLAAFGRFLTNIDIHPGAEIGARFFIDHGAGVVIGETAIIGDNVTIYHGVTLGGTSWNKGKRHPTLGNGVMVGAGAKLLGNINIQSNARIGANSVVVNDVPEGCTVVGIPGKIVQPPEHTQTNRYGVDLNHHLIPDPVSKVIGCLMERIHTLEEKLQIADEDIECHPENQFCAQQCTQEVDPSDFLVTDTKRQKTSIAD